MHDGRLLRDFVDRGSQAAFDQIVRRHLALVYSVCRREVGEAALAEDVTQVVFLLLARKASSLRREPTLDGWLFQAARLASKDALKGEARRRRREDRAAQRMTYGDSGHALWDEVAPFLNDALAALGRTERDAVLLRVFEGHSLAETGAALGMTEEAARKRVTRALERVRRHLAKEGVTVGGVALAALLSERAVHAAPPACAVAVTRIASGAASGHAGFATASVRVTELTKGVTKTMWMTKAMSATAFLVAGLGAAGITSLAAHTHHRHPASSSGHRPTAQPAASSAKAFSGAASLDEVQKLQLRDGFTLTYDVIVRDVRTPQMKDAELEYVQKSYKAANVPQAQINDMIKGLRSSDSLTSLPRRFTDTVSARDGRLLYVRQQYGGQEHSIVDGQPVVEPYSKQVVLYDGHRTFRYDSIPSNLQVWPGLHSEDLFQLPVPGCGLPNLPLVKPIAPDDARRYGLTASQTSGASGDGGRLCDVLCLRNVNTWYSPGQVYTEGVGPHMRLTKIALGWPGHPGAESEEWDFQQPMPLRGIHVAGHTHHTIGFGNNSNHIPPEQLRLVDDYQLTQAQAIPLPPAQFDMQTYLPPNTPVTVNDGQRHYLFQYRTDGGDLDTQIKNAALAQSSRP